jgi:preprotein translocase subunit YajC
MLDIISSAYAATATNAGATPENNIASLLLIVGFVVVFYFILWRPQSKRAKEQRNLIANLAKGDEVVTSGGLIGKISKLTDDFMVLAVTDNLEIKMQRNAVIAVLPKGTMKAI